ncbi:spore germination protein GerPE [Lentibacillus jeotgali]|uniref:spore germination protein GerPE n=1 Tax=Lentibacillus jeotgali TaxID=558169 RepID=UPI001584CAD0|nr:spore germination protein GerPE [Lentibacillus jeotgali]
MNGLTFSGVFNIGDTRRVRSTSRGIALQKEGARFRAEDNVDFNDYSLFNRKINLPETKTPVQKDTCHHSDTISVSNVDIIGISEAALFQIGNLGRAYSESRIKHFRRYLPD